MSKSLNDIAIELTIISLEKNAGKTWTLQDTAESFKNTHEELLNELKKIYGTNTKDYQV